MTGHKRPYELKLVPELNKGVKRTSSHFGVQRHCQSKDIDQFVVSKSESATTTTRSCVGEGSRQSGQRTARAISTNKKQEKLRDLFHPITRQLGQETNWSTRCEIRTGKIKKLQIVRVHNVRVGGGGQPFAGALHQGSHYKEILDSL